jgi:hypothetical protein
MGHRGGDSESKADKVVGGESVKALFREEKDTREDLKTQEGIEPSGGVNSLLVATDEHSALNL